MEEGRKGMIKMVIIMMKIVRLKYHHLHQLQGGKRHLLRLGRKGQDWLRIGMFEVIYNEY